LLAFEKGMDPKAKQKYEDDQIKALKKPAPKKK